MKIQSREVTTTETFYIAIDGKEFGNMSDCLAYEHNLLEESCEPFMDLPKEEISGEDLMDAILNPAYDDAVFFVYIDSEETRKIVSNFLLDRGDKEISVQEIGTVQMIWVWSDESDAMAMGDTEKLKAGFVKMIDEHAKAAMDKRIEYNNELLKAKEENK